MTFKSWKRPKKS